MDINQGVWRMAWTRWKSTLYKQYLGILVAYGVSTDWFRVMHPTDDFSVTVKTHPVPNLHDNYVYYRRWLFSVYTYICVWLLLSQHNVDLYVGHNETWFVTLISPCTASSPLSLHFCCTFSVWIIRCLCLWPLDHRCHPHRRHHTHAGHRSCFPLMHIV